MLKNLVKIAALALVLSAGGVATADPIKASGGTSSVKAAKAAQKASQKAAKRALKAQKKCLKRAAKKGIAASSCGGSSTSLSAPVLSVAAAPPTSTNGPSCTSNCATVVVAVDGPSGQATPVPEPTTLALLGAGLLGMGLAARRRRAASTNV